MSALFVAPRHRLLPATGFMLMAARTAKTEATVTAARKTKKAEKVEKVEKVEKAEKAVKVVKKAEPAEKAVKAVKAVKKAEPAEKPKVEKAEKAEKVEKVKAEKPKAEAAAKLKKSGEELLMSFPDRNTVTVLRKGWVTEPKPHWIPVPKNRASPYLTYFKEFTTLTAKEWNLLTPEQKKKYDDLAAEDQKRYEKEVEEYFKNRTWDQFYQQKIPAQLQGLDPLKPPKLPAGSYAIFISDFRTNYPNITPAKGLKEQSKIAGQKWKELTEAERKVYAEKATEVKENFEREWDAYLKKLPTKPNKAL